MRKSNTQYEGLCDSITYLYVYETARDSTYKKVDIHYRAL